MGVGLGGTGKGFGVVVFGGWDFSPSSLGSGLLREEKTWMIKGGIMELFSGLGWKGV